MTTSLFSESWYRVAELKPRLRPHAKIHRHTYRNEDWYVLQDHLTGRFHRFSFEAYLAIGLMDGRRTAAEIWEAVCGRLGDDMPTQDEFIVLLSKLHQADVLQSNILPDTAELLDRRLKQRRSRRLLNLRSPMSLRFPLLDPDRFLSGTLFLVRPLLGRFGAVLWGVVVIYGLVLAAMHWDALTSNLADRVLAMENLFLLWLIYPFAKALHELGHAYLVKHWGGEVHEMGIMLLVFMPVPYVDASSSSAFSDKKKRMLVGAAGIFVELFLAATAMFVWVNAAPGTARALAFNVMLIAGVSTVFFNGNPLLRFDAYYILSDFLEIPNLGSRGNKYVGYWVKRYLFGIVEADSPASSLREAWWLATYTIAAFVYRIGLYLRIALFVAGKFFFLGVLLACWATSTMLLMPTFRVMKTFFTDPALQRKRGRVLGICFFLTGLLAVLVLAFPFPAYIAAEGVIWPPEKSQIFVGADGFITEVIARPGQKMSRGAPLLRCENMELTTRVAMLAAELKEMEARHLVKLQDDRIGAGIIQDEIERIQAELAQTREQVADLLISSPADGVFLMPRSEDALHRFVKRGQALGYVVDFSKVTVRTVVRQAEVDQVRSRLQNVELRLAGALEKVFSSRVIREAPAATTDMPSLALSLEGGGGIALDPRESRAPKAFETLFHFDLAITDIPVERIGERVFIRFVLSPEPLAARWYRTIRGMLIKRFDV